jgi:hypothetical protein
MESSFGAYPEDKAYAESRFNNLFFEIPTGTKKIKLQKCPNGKNL